MKKVIVNDVVFTTLIMAKKVVEGAVELRAVDCAAVDQIEGAIISG